MTDFKIKPDITNKLVNELINDLHSNNSLLSQKFTIHEIQGIEVQILVTKDEEDLLQETSLDYLNAIS